MEVDYHLGKSCSALFCSKLSIWEIREILHSLILYSKLALGRHIMQRTPPTATTPKNLWIISNHVRRRRCGVVHVCARERDSCNARKCTRPITQFSFFFVEQQPKQPTATIHLGEKLVPCLCVVKCSTRDMVIWYNTNTDCRVETHWIEEI